MEFAENETSGNALCCPESTRRTFVACPRRLAGDLPRQRERSPVASIAIAWGVFSRQNVSKLILFRTLVCSLADLCSSVRPAKFFTGRTKSLVCPEKPQDHIPVEPNLSLLIHGIRYCYSKRLQTRDRKSVV